jgi:hypothetical protein
MDSGHTLSRNLCALGVANKESLGVAGLRVSGRVAGWSEWKRPVFADIALGTQSAWLAIGSRLEATEMMAKPALFIGSLCVALAGCMGMADGTSNSAVAHASPVDGSAAVDMGGSNSAGDMGTPPKTCYRDAEVDLDRVGTSHVNGELLFLGPQGAVTVVSLASGFDPQAQYSAVIHENGKCSNNAKDAGPEWNAGAALAELGAVTVDAHGVGTLTKSAAWTIGDHGMADIINHALVVQDANKNIVACGVIRR